MKCNISYSNYKYFVLISVPDLATMGKIMFRRGDLIMMSSQYWVYILLCHLSRHNLFDRKVVSI